jgi:folate-binding protein YgfZ
VEIVAAVSPSTYNQVLALRRRGGFTRLEHHTLVEVAGVDAAKYLQARLSNDVNQLTDGQGQMTSLLDRKAHLIAYFSLHRISAEQFLLFMETEQLETVMHELEMYHFQEKLTYRALDWPLWTVQGGAAALLREPTDGFVVFEQTLSGDTGFVYARTAGGAAPFADLEQQARSLDMVPLDKEALNIARVEGGLPRWKVDFGPEELLPETGLENTAASYAKGCFQGQEVLARIRTYGAPKRGLVGLLFEPGSKISWGINTPILLGDTEIGTLKSNVYSPTLERTIAMAYVQREYRVPDTELLISLGGAQHKAVVIALPFYNPELRKKQARKLYDAALNEFTTGSEVRAIEELRDAIKLDPFLADAYEALGVALSRQEELDEAITVMKQLERLEPESIMAHANLSIFYMQKGDKETAEDYKAKAMSIRMSQMAREYSQKQAQDEEIRKRKADAEQRMAMFKQVLAIDPDDFLANAGMGSAYSDMEKHAEALPFLEKALQVRPTHTVAYHSLANAYEQLGQTDRAIEVYKQGIAIAAQRGDMTPMKAMQAELDRLSQNSHK